MFRYTHLSATVDKDMNNCLLLFFILDWVLIFKNIIDKMQKLFWEKSINQKIIGEL